MQFVRFDTLRPLRTFGRRKTTPRLVAGVVAAPAAALLFSYCAFRLHFNLATAGSLELLVVVLAALKSGLGAATGSSVVAIACLDYFFAPPIHSFHVADPQNWVALASFEFTALIVSRLSVQVQSQMRQAVLQRGNTEQLYQLSRSILSLNRQEPPGRQIAYLIEKNIGVDAVALFDAGVARLDTAGTCTEEDEELARSTYFRNTNDDDRERYKWRRVLRLGATPIGAIVLSGADLTPLIVDSIASLTATALERARSLAKESRAEAARQTEQLRTAVLDGLAHAFKTPLTVISTCTSGLLEMKTLTPAEADLVELIDQHSTRLSALTTHLLRMAKLESAEIRLRRESVEIPRLIGEILDECSTQLCGHSVQLCGATKDLMVSGDRELLAMTISELLVNAAKYSSSDSPIIVGAQERDNKVLISVHNEGGVIDPEDRELIFERFYRSSSAKHRASGSGIGLSIAKKTAEAHQGSLWVSSESETGTTFYLSLPAIERREHERTRKQGSRSR
jgi:two-component system sensor histidine kinase KdpD